MREKAKVVLVLMEDDDKLKEERDFAVKTREKTSKSSAGELFCPEVSLINVHVISILVNLISQEHVEAISSNTHLDSRMN